MQEEWRPVVGYEGLYSVSNLGRVRAEEIERPSKWGTMMKVPERIMSLSILEGRKYRVSLTKDKKRSSYTVHRLVAQAFIPNPENKTDVNHLDNNPLNNRVDNLEWLTHKENMEYSAKQGRTRVYLTPERILEAQELIEQGVPRYKISKQLKMCPNTMRRIFGGVPCKSK